MSYQSFKKKCADRAQPPDRVARESDVAARALELFGTEASTAIALCGLEAWFEGEEQEFRLWSDILLRLHN